MSGPMPVASYTAWDWQGPITKPIDHANCVNRTDLYRLYDADYELLYVGISSDARIRFKKHRRRAWWSDVENIIVARYDNRWLPEIYEAHAIRDERPAFNAKNGAAWALNATKPDERTEWSHQIAYAEFHVSEYQERTWFENPINQAGVLAI